MIENHQNDLRNDHGLRCVEELEHAEWSRVGNEQVNEETCHDWRETHRGIYNHGQSAPPRKAIHRQHAANREANDGSDRDGGQSYLQRQRDDLNKLWIEIYDLPQGGAESFGYV